MDTLTLLQQPHFHLGSHVTQVNCCCFSPDGYTILSGSCDKTLKLWRTHDTWDSRILSIPTLVDRDVCSFLDQTSSVPLSKFTRTVLKILCEPSDKAFSLRCSVLQLVVSQLYTFCSKSTVQQAMLIRKHDDLQRSVNTSTHKVQEHIEQVERIRQQLAEAEKQLASSLTQHETLVDEEKKCFEQQTISNTKSDELSKIRDFYKGELDKTRCVMNQLSSKLKENRDVSCLSQEEVLLFLQELDIPKSIRDSFKKNQVGGKALNRISDPHLRELGMSDINQRKGLLHAICNVRVHGCIRVTPSPGACGDGLAAWWSADEVWKWLEEQDFNFPCLKGLTGQSLIHLSDEDISQFGLPMDPALELKEKCETLKQSFFSYRDRDHQPHHKSENYLLFV